MKAQTASRGLTAYLGDARARVDAALAAWAERGGGDPVIRYSLLGEGKRLRPTLVFAAHEALGGGGCGARRGRR